MANDNPKRLKILGETPGIITMPPTSGNTGIVRPPNADDKRAKLDGRAVIDPAGILPTSEPEYTPLDGDGLRPTGGLALLGIAVIGIGGYLLLSRGKARGKKHNRKPGARR